MGKEILLRQLINNKTLFWALIRNSTNYSCCNIDADATFRKCIVRNQGKGNSLVIESGAKVSGCTIVFNGNNNSIIVRKHADVNGCTFYLDDDGNCIDIGEQTTFTGKTDLVVAEGTKIKTGTDCMFAYGIVMRTSDFHSIFNAEKKRTNLSKDIILGDHVWVAQNAVILKGVSIPDGGIVGACAVVTKGTDEKSPILVGNPAKVIKTEIIWDRDRMVDFPER